MKLYSRPQRQRAVYCEQFFMFISFTLEKVEIIRSTFFMFPGEGIPIFYNYLFVCMYKVLRYPVR